MFVEVYEVHLDHEIRVVGSELEPGAYLDAERLAEITGGELVIRLEPLEVPNEPEPVPGHSVETIRTGELL